jgi:two-component system LytT family response regulator
MSYPLSHYESILPKKTFLRVHKSFIINTKFIKQIQKSPGYTILLHSGETIPISKRRVADIITQLQK